MVCIEKIGEKNFFDIAFFFRLEEKCRLADEIVWRGECEAQITGSGDDQVETALADDATGSQVNFMDSSPGNKKCIPH